MFVVVHSKKWMLQNDSNLLSKCFSAADGNDKMVVVAFHTGDGMIPGGQEPGMGIAK